MADDSKQFQKNARYLIRNGGHVTVYGDWLGDGGNVSTSGVLVLEGPAAGRSVRVTGALNVDGFVCTNAPGGETITAKCSVSRTRKHSPNWNIATGFYLFVR